MQNLEQQILLEATTMAIVTQGGPSYSFEKMECAYRGSNGRKCAIGHLIDDRFYSPHFEGVGVECGDIRRAIRESLGCAFTRKDLRLLRKLQVAHDLAVKDWAHAKQCGSAIPLDDYFWNRWAKRLKIVCEDLGLRFPEELI